MAVASSERVERDWRAGEAEGAQLPYVVAEQGRGPRWAGAAVVGVAEETRTQEAAPDETSAAETWTGAGASEARREGRRRGVRDAEDELRLELMR